MNRESKVAFSVSMGEFSLETAVPVHLFAEAFDSLVTRNDELRARDENPELRAYRRIRIQCPNCGGSIFHLTAFTRDGETVRACRKCQIEFSVDV